ncbi:hypothetical protein FOZ63_027318, partial [Perkinsus olseni]
ITEKIASCLGGRVSWNGPYNVDLRRRLPSPTLGDNSRRVSLAVNWTYTASMVSELQRDATEKIRHGAFMHHYNVYGVDEETVFGAAQDVHDTIVTPYKMAFDPLLTQTVLAVLYGSAAVRRSFRRLAASEKSGKRVLVVGTSRAGRKRLDSAGGRHIFLLLMSGHLLGIRVGIRVK